MLTILWTNKFSKKIKKFNEMQFQVASVVNKIIVAERANPTNWHKHIKKLKDESFGNLAVYREYLPDGARFVFILEDENFILVDVGGHDVSSEYSRQSSTVINADLATKREPDEWFMKLLSKRHIGAKTKATFKNVEVNFEAILQENFGDDDSFRWWHESELNEAWLQYLDKQQQQVADKIYNSILAGGQEFKVTFIIGGPGTGKTIVLLNLAINLTNVKKSILFELPHQVFQYLNSGSRPLPGNWRNRSPAKKSSGKNRPEISQEILLIDDPSSAQELNQRITRAKNQGFKSVVVALDPIQWHDGSRLNSFKKMSSVKSLEICKLNVCYRQSKGVGKESHAISKNIFNLSTRNRNEITSGIEEKEKTELISSIDAIKFVDEGGRFKIYEEFTVRDLEKEIYRFSGREYKWTHTAPIAFVYGKEFLPDWRETVKRLSLGQKRIDVALTDYQRIRGVEFQELFLFLSLETWRGITKGKHGLSSQEWNALSSLYTVVSRPKDGLVVFVK